MGLDKVKDSMFTHGCKLPGQLYLTFAWKDTQSIFKNKAKKGNIVKSRHRIQTKNSTGAHKSSSSH